MRIKAVFCALFPIGDPVTTANSTATRNSKTSLKALGVRIIYLLIDIVLLGLLVITAITIARMKDLFGAVMLAGIYGLLSASFFVLMDAVDVAFTEAAVGAGIAPLLMFATLAVTGRYQQSSASLSKRNLGLVIVLGGLIAFASLDLPEFGSGSAPAHQHVAPRYLNQSAEEIGIPNVVTSVLASYRGFDTFGEVVVIFTAGIGVMALLMTLNAVGKTENGDESLQQHKILRVVSKILIPPIMIFALYVQFHGEYSPGGGFQAGVIFAAAIILYAMLFGLSTAEKVINASVVRVLAALGVLIYGSVGVVNLVGGKNFLDYSSLAENPITGQHVGILLVELGVGLTVASVMVLIYFAFAATSHLNGVDHLSGDG